MLQDLFSFDMKKHPFNQAAKLFGQLRFYEMGSTKFMELLEEIIPLCWESLRRNKYDGDSHVLLANTYLLGMFGAKISKNPDRYIQNTCYCAAVIQEWKNNPAMYTKEKIQGEKIYQEVLSNIKEDMSEKMTISMDEFMQGLHDKYYAIAVGIDKK